MIDDRGYALTKERSKELIIIGGENNSASKIENTLAMHPAVLDCAMVAAPDDQRGEILIAIVALKPAAAASGDELLAHYRTHLAWFKTPKRIEFRGALPKRSRSKILNSELREPFWQGQDKWVR